MPSQAKDPPAATRSSTALPRGKVRVPPDPHSGGDGGDPTSVQSFSGATAAVATLQNALMADMSLNTGSGKTFKPFLVKIANVMDALMSHLGHMSSKVDALNAQCASTNQNPMPETVSGNVSGNIDRATLSSLVAGFNEHKEMMLSFKELFSAKQNVNAIDSGTDTIEAVNSLSSQISEIRNEMSSLKETVAMIKTHNQGSWAHVVRRGDQKSSVPTPTLSVKGKLISTPFFVKFNGSKVTNTTEDREKRAAVNSALKAIDNPTVAASIPFFAVFKDGVTKIFCSNQETATFLMNENWINNANVGQVIRPKPRPYAVLEKVPGHFKEIMDEVIAETGAKSAKFLRSNLPPTSLGAVMLTFDTEAQAQECIDGKNCIIDRLVLPVVPLRQRAGAFLCYNCWGKDHVAAKCKQARVCGRCAENHEKDVACNVDTTIPKNLKCIRCVRANQSDCTGHAASSSACHSMIATHKL